MFPKGRVRINDIVPHSCLTHEHSHSFCGVHNGLSQRDAQCLLGKRSTTCSTPPLSHTTFQLPQLGPTWSKWIKQPASIPSSVAPWPQRQRSSLDTINGGMHNNFCFQASVRLPLRQSHCHSNCHTKDSNSDSHNTSHFDCCETTRTPGVSKKSGRPRTKVSCVQGEGFLPRRLAIPPRIVWTGTQGEANLACNPL